MYKVNFINNLIYSLESLQLNNPLSHWIRVSDISLFLRIKSKKAKTKTEKL